MKKALSAYWWCQILGWGLFLLFGTYFYFSGSGIAHFPSYLSLIITALLGVLTTHLMRVFIIQTKILNQKIWIQFVCMFIIAIVFSFMYFVFQWTSEFLHSPKGFSDEYKSWTVLGSVITNFNFLIIWIFIYFSYHYIEKSRRHLIETVRLESELKIKQLESDKAQIEYQRNLGNYYLMAADATIHDLIDDAGKPSGTKVIIQIPV